MSSVHYGLTILKYCGLWRPESWLPGWKSRLFGTYTIFTIILIFSMTLMETIDLMMSFENIHQIADKCTVTVTMLTICCKIVILLVNRSRILQLLQTLQCDFFCALNLEERRVKEKNNEKIRSRAKFLTWMTMLALIARLPTILITCVPQETLWINAWMPFNITTSTQYIFMLSFELVSHYSAAIVSMGYDILVPSIMLETLVQYALLQYRIYIRLKVMGLEVKENSVYNDENKTHIEKIMIADWVRHHLLILQFARETNEIFWLSILLQYCSSIILFCVNINALAQIPVFSLSFLGVLLYIMILYLQILLLCLAGTDVNDYSLHFSSSIYDTQWYVLSQSSEKSILLMMVQSNMPIEFTSASIIEVSLDSFVRMVKISYSAYNFLQRLSQNQ